VAHDSTIVLRRVRGPEATELFLLCRPAAEVAGAGPQAEAAYRAIFAVLQAEEGSFASVVSETLYLRDLRTHLEPVRAARRRVLAACEGMSHRPATMEIEQPPLNAQSCLEVAVQAILPQASPLQVETFGCESACRCPECARLQGLRVRLGEETRLHAGGLCGPGANAYEQTLAMFDVAEALLKRAGMEFRDVARTWIHLRHIGRDYDHLNRARRAFFGARDIAPVPASTGIGGGPASDAHDICLSLYAVRAAHPTVRTVMTAPTLNDAAHYGADFARGTRVVDTNKVALCVSGTASIDEAGATAYPGNFEAQAERMLVNVAGLLEGQGAAFADVVSAVTYLRCPADGARLREKFREAGFEGFPNVFVQASICRPELLCETEALAVLPLSGTEP
jgi:enamine deaminase RidA (YjgF/YER057c/UK114 family)